MKVGRSKELAVIALAALVVATALASLMMYLAWEHNPQGTFHESDDGAILVHWGAWLAIGASWFVLVSLSVAALGLVLRVALSVARRRAVR